jgi:hypothetical protein
MHLKWKSTVRSPLSLNVIDPAFLFLICQSQLFPMHLSPTLFRSKEFSPTSRFRHDTTGCITLGGRQRHLIALKINAPNSSLCALPRAVFYAFFNHSKIHHRRETAARLNARGKKDEENFPASNYFFSIFDVADAVAMYKKTNSEWLPRRRCMGERTP